MMLMLFVAAFLTAFPVHAQEITDEERQRLMDAVSMPLDDAVRIHLAALPILDAGIRNGRACLFEIKLHGPEATSSQPCQAFDWNARTMNAHMDGGGQRANTRLSIADERGELDSLPAALWEQLKQVELAINAYNVVADRYMEAIGGD